MKFHLVVRLMCINHNVEIGRSDWSHSKAKYYGIWILLL